MAEYFKPGYQGTTEQGAFDPAAAFIRGGHEAAETQSLFSDDLSQLDELELIKAAREQLRHPPKAGKEEQKEIAKKMLETGEFQARIAEVVKHRPGGLVTVEIEYKDVTIEAEALVGESQNPTVWNSFKSAISNILPLAKLHSHTKVKILDGVSGVLKPGRFTLVLGPPGSGKSVLMQHLSGRLHQHRGLRAQGSIKYNGEDVNSFVVQRTAGLVDQYDKHIPNLTVLETVRFAAGCQLPTSLGVGTLSAVKELLLISRRRKKRRAKQGENENTDADREEAEREVSESIQASLVELGEERRNDSSFSGTDHPELEEEFLDLLHNVVLLKAKPFVTLHLLGLQNVADTFVGDESLRGVSGGEKKRVTSAEVLVGSQWAIFMDEISTGLDSATAFSVTKSLRDACHTLQRTIVVSLLQPPPEVMQLFDDLLLLTDGKVIYHGPLTDALPFFASLGFICPSRKDPGSFLQEVTTPVGQFTYASPELLKEHGLSESDRSFEKLTEEPPEKLLVTVDAMAEAFWSTPSGKAIDEQLTLKPFDRSRGNPNSLARTRYARSGIRLSILTLKRQMLLMRRDKAYYIARMIQSVLMGLIISSFFASVAPGNTPQENLSQGRKVLSLCVLSIIYLSMSSMPVLGFVFNTKGVFYKHRDNYFFPSWSYSVSHALSQVPSSTAESILYSLSVYWISGLNRNAGNYFIFLLVTWSCSNSLAGVFRLLAYVTPNMVRANALGSLILLLLMLTNGFTIVRTSIPDYLIWIYYGLNPLSYGVRALAINELTSPSWGESGYVVLEQFKFFTEKEWIWIAVGFNWGFLFLLVIVGALALKYINPPSPKPSVSLEEQKVLTEQGIGQFINKRRSTLMSRAAKSFKTLTSLGSSKDTSDMVIEKQPPKRQKAMPVAFQPVVIVCKNLCYYVRDPSGGTAPGVVKDEDDKEIAGKLQLLHDINFYSEPGMLTALMGGSGAGKTTLMDVVAGRKTQGIIRGEILANGRLVEPQIWSRVVGYVEQMDVHSACITVLESLRFAARLRLSEKDVSDAQVEAIVQETLATIELEKLKDLVVGNPGGEGLSIEQRKRLSIGVELVGNPSVLFMDEPTSGLDARAAAIVMRAVRNVSNSNRTVTVTIHQPSMEIFEAFDMLVLLQRGGRLTYFGPLGKDSQDLISYLQSYPGVVPIQDGYNPATWMLEVTGGSMATTFQAADVDFPKEYKNGSFYQQCLDKMESLVSESLQSTSPLTMDAFYATSYSTQARELLRKYFAYYWRAPHYNFVRVMMTLIIALIYGLIYLNEGKTVHSGSDSASVDQVQNIMGLIFSLAIFNGMFNCMTVMPVIFAEREVFYRQRAASMYAPRALGLAQGIAELPYLAVQAIVMVCITYWMVGFQPVAWKFFYFLLMFFLSVTMYTFLGQFLVISTPNPLLAQLLAAFLNQMWTIFNGFLVPYTQTPVGWQWMSRISPTTWILYGLGASQLADSDVILEGYPGSTTVGEFVSNFWGYDYGFVWWCPLIVFAYVAFFRVAAVLSLSYISYNKR